VDCTKMHRSPPSHFFGKLVYRLDYFWSGRSSGTDADIGESGISILFTDSGISFACASNSLTCHSWVSVSLVLKEGIPERRIPLAAFQ